MSVLAGKKVVVTGGSRGIGAAIVRTAMEEGADVAFVYQKSEDAAQALSRDLVSKYPGQKCLPWQCDVADADEMREVIAAITKEMERIDVLVNNAGITRDAAFARMSRQHWDEVITTNLGSMYNATQPLVLPLVKQRSGAIINLTSVAGIYGTSGQANYAASKAGIIGFTKSLSNEISPFGVRVNAVAPGFIETDMVSLANPDRLNQMKQQIPVKRLGTVDEVAHVVCFLASEKASYITGQVIEVSGGLTL